MQRISNLIGGELVSPGSGQFLENFEPATGLPYSLVPRSDESDVARAVDAARSAFPAWATLPVQDRSQRLLALAAHIEGESERFARAESVDNGKPIALARRMDIPRAVANLRFFATAILHASSETHATDYQALNYTLRRPRGVVGAISPWNLPLYLLTWKVAPALATGNTVVAKPSELTPMTAYLLSQAAAKILPPGVLNVVHGIGSEAGTALVRHPSVETLSFTGGTLTGAAIAATAAPAFKKVALEMGGKNPTIVFADADLDEALATSVRAAFQNQGEICLSGSRLFVEEPVFEAFADRFAAAARTLVVGDPLDDATEQGALVSLAHLDKVRSYVDLALSEGGRVVCGGGVPRNLPDRCKAGYFLEPTVIRDLDPACRVNQEEIFGPVVTLLPFRDVEEVLAAANGTRYGLSASVWTRDLPRALALAERLETGTVWINCWLLRDLRVPFGGVKSSGLGREGGAEALHFFTEPKNVCMRYPPDSGPRRPEGER